MTVTLIIVFCMKKYAGFRSMSEEISIDICLFVKPSSVNCLHTSPHYWTVRLALRDPDTWWMEWIELLVPWVGSDLRKTGFKCDAPHTWNELQRIMDTLVSLGHLIVNLV